MIGYVFLLLALFSGATKGYCGKRTSGIVVEYKDTLFANFIRMMFCVVIGMAVVCLQGSVNELAIDGNILLITLLSGVTTSIFVVTWLISVRNGAYMMLDVFLMLGVVIPMLFSLIFFGESIRVNQWIGLGLLLIAVLIMCSYNNQIKEKISVVSLILLIVCGVANGLTDFSQKLFVKGNENVSIFNFYTYVFSSIVLFGVYLAERLKEKKTKTRHSEVSVLRNAGGYILVMAVCLFANSFFKTLAAKHLESAVLYPLNQGSALIISSFMSRIFFKEKLTKRCILGLVLAFVALLIVNLL